MDSQTASGKTKQPSEIEKNLCDIEKNKKFANSLPFLLTRLKSRLIQQNFLSNLNNAKEMIEKNIIGIFEDILGTQSKDPNPSENLCFSLGDILLELSKIFIQESSIPEHKNCYNEFLVEKHNLLEIITNFLINIASSKEKAIKIFLDLYCELILYDLNFNKNVNAIEISLTFLIAQLERYNNNNDLITNILETINKVAKTKPFEIFLTSNKESDSYINFVKKIYDIVSTQTIPVIIFTTLEIIDEIINININLNEQNVESKPPEFFLSLLSKHHHEPTLCFYACKVLSQIMKEEEIKPFITFLKTDSIETLNSQINAVSPKQKPLLQELKELIEKEKDVHLSMKRNITRTLLLYTRRNKSEEIISNTNIIENFIDLLTLDISELEKRESKDPYAEMIKISFPDLIRILINLVKNFNFEQRENNQSNTLLSIVDNFCKVLKLLPEEKIFIQEIITFFINKIELKELDVNNIMTIYQKHKENTDSIFTELVKRYYDTTWLYSFLHIINIKLVYPELSDFSPFLNDLKELDSALDKLQQIYKEEPHKKMKFLTNALSLKLILGNGLGNQNNDGYNIMFEIGNESSMIPSLLVKIFDKMINLVINRNPKSSEVYNDENIIFIITLVFSVIENIEFKYTNKEQNGNITTFDLKDKCGLLFKLLLKLLDTKTLTYPTISYLSMRLSLLVKYKLESIISFIFNDSNLITFIVGNLNIFQANKTSDMMIKEIFIILHNIFTQSKNEIQIVRFIEENGLITLMKIIEDNSIIDEETNNALIQNLNVMASKNLEGTCLLFEEGTYFKNLLHSLKSIKYQKKINVNVYSGMQSFFLKVFQVYNFYDTADESNTITHYLSEYKDIFTTNENTKNQALEIISEIIYTMCLGLSILQSVSQTNELSLLHNKILNKMLAQEMFNPILFENIINIESTFYGASDIPEVVEPMKNIYNESTTANSFENIKQIIMDNFVNIKDILKIVNFIENIIIFENEIKAVNCDYKELFPKDFVTQLKEKCVESKSNLIEKKVDYDSIIEKLEKLISNPENFTMKLLGKKTMTEENKRMARELIEITSGRKNTVRICDKDTNKKTKEQICPLCINDNPTLKNYFEKVSNMFQLCVKQIPNKHLAKQDTSLECDKLAFNLSLWQHFMKEEQNIYKIFEIGTLDKLIIIVESDTIFPPNCQENAFNILEQLLLSEVSNEFLLKDNNFMGFMLRELQRITKIYEEKGEATGKNNEDRIVMVSKIIAKLTEHVEFVGENISRLSRERLFDIVKNNNCTGKVAEYFLIILKNIIYYQENKEKNGDNEKHKKENNEKLCELLCNTLWNKYKKENNALKSIINVILSKSNDEHFIKLVLDHKIPSNICQMLIDSETSNNSVGFVEAIDLLNFLVNYKETSSSIVDIAIIPLITAGINNLSNSPIIDYSLTLFLHCIHLDENYISKVCSQNMNEYTVKVLGKYIGSEYLDILKKCVELIKYVLSDYKHLSYYYDTCSSLLVKVCKDFNQNEEYACLTLDILNKIVESDAAKNTTITKGSNDVIGEIAKEHKNEENKQDTEQKVTDSVQDTKTQALTNAFCDIDTLSKIFEDLFNIYFESLNFLTKAYKFLENLQKTTKQKDIHDILFNLFLKSGEILISQPEIETQKIEIFANSLFNWTKTEPDLENDFHKVLYIINEMLSKNKETNSIDNFTSVISFLSSNKKISISELIDQLYTELIRYCNYYMDKRYTIQNISSFIKTLGNLCQNETIEYTALIDLSEKTFKLILTCLQPNQENSSQIETMLPEILKDIYHISKYYMFPNKETAEELYKIIISLFDVAINKKQDESLITLFQILEVFSQSNYVKEFFKSSKEQRSFIDVYTKYKKKEKHPNIEKEKLMQELPKRFLKSINIISSTPSTNEGNKVDSKKLFYQLSKDEVTFLYTEQRIYYHTEQGKTVKCYGIFNQDLNEFLIYERNKGDNVVTAELLLVNEIESIEQNCTNPAFTKKKFKLFGNKKPHPQKCFSILEVKKDDKSQKAFCFECKEEDICQMYIKLITKLINNLKK